MIFDFDGTLADTRKSIIKTMQKTLNYFKIYSTPDEKIIKLIGIPLKETFESITDLKGEDLYSAMAKYRSYYSKISFETVTLFPKVKDTLEALKKNNIKLGVASSRGKKSLLMLLKHLEISSLFSFIGAEDDVINKKPAPDTVNLGMEKLQSSSSSTLVIGDTIYDVQMGQGAGCRTCAVTYGNNTVEELNEYKPDYMISDFSELLNIANL